MRRKFSAPTDDNFVVISPTSIGGQKQARVNFNFDPDNRQFENPANPLDVNFQHLYLADQALDGPGLSFITPLHMQGTLSFDTPSGQAIEPNFFFGWYNGGDTRHRVGLALSNVVEAPFTPAPDSLRVDLGYASSAGNKFYYVTADGTPNQTGSNSRLPDGAYQFTFDYARRSEYTGEWRLDQHHGHGCDAQLPLLTRPLENAPWFFDPFELDRFGIVIRSMNAAVRQGIFNFTISNVTYTGGTAVPEPSTAMLAMLTGLGTLALCRRRENGGRIN